MSYAALMVHVDVDGEIGRRVTVAAGLADLFDAGLIGIAAWAPMSVFLAKRAREERVPAETHLQDMKALLDQKGQEFCAAVGTGGRRVEWRSVLDFPTEAVAREARAADLVIVGNARENRDPFRALDPGGLLLKAGRPVLAVPTSVTKLSPQRVVIAWKDTREARRAVGDALPFLQRAENVMLLEISEDGGGEQPSLCLKDVAGYLTRHRVGLIVERVRYPDVTTTNSLLRFIHDENIDLIVAGAYGHSRMGEWVFGGVTRQLLAESPICCLFSN
jgi:nucleotide-binding universal stress UspA family protein